MSGLDGRGLEPVAGALERGELGGLILFREDLGSLAETRTLIETARALSPHPILVTVDEEGGLVSQLDGLPLIPGGPDRLVMAPAPGALGEADDVALTERVFHRAGAALADAGIDVAFAPLVDVNVRPDNPVIGRRSFAATPDRVARHARAALRGLAAGGVVGCPKHFPGHGATTTDSHHGLPVVPDDCAEIERRDLAPYRAVLADHVPLVMSAHVHVPALDPAPGPATRSSRILTDLLRGGLGFRGAVVSDALEMAGFGEEEGLGTGVVAALRAGVDLFLRARDVGVTSEIRAALSAARGEPGGLHALERAAGAVAALHTWCGLVRQRAQPSPSTDPMEAHRRLTRVVRPPAPPTGPLTIWLPEAAPAFVLREDAVRTGLAALVPGLAPATVVIRRYGAGSALDPSGGGRGEAGGTAVIVLYVRGAVPSDADRDAIARLEAWRRSSGSNGAPSRNAVALAVADHAALDAVPAEWGAVGATGCHESAFAALAHAWTAGRHS